MFEFYGFDKNWLNDLDYLYYLKTIHTSTYNTLLESISFFRKENTEFLNLKYKLLYRKKEWKSVIGTTKTILRKDNKKPKFAITLAVKNNDVLDFDNENGLRKLTVREKEIMKLLCNSLSKKEVANHLFISENIVHTHSKN